MPANEIAIAHIAQGSKVVNKEKLNNFDVTLKDGVMSVKKKL